MTVLTLFMLMQMPSPRDIVIYWPGPRAFSVAQKPWGWAHISLQKPRRARGMVTSQIDTCITQFYRIKGGGCSGAPLPPPIIFEQQILPQQTIYRGKGNLTASRIHFKYWRNILISRFYENFSRNGSKCFRSGCSKKISTL